MADTGPGAAQAALAARPWVAAAVAFNLSPLKDLDQSWLQALPNGGLVPHLRGAAAERWVSRYLLDAFDLTGRYWEDFSAPRTRLALLDRAALQRVLLHVGLVIHGDEVRNALDGRKVKSLRAALGPAAVDFAVKTAPLYGAPPETDYRPAGPDDPLARFMLAGAVHSLHRRAVGDAAYLTRVAFKLPHILHEPLAKLADDWPAEAAGDDLPRLTRRIIKDLVPQWLTLFN